MAKYHKPSWQYAVFIYMYIFNAILKLFHMDKTVAKQENFCVYLCVCACVDVVACVIPL